LYKLFGKDEGHFWGLIHSLYKRRTNYNILTLATWKQEIYSILDDGTLHSELLEFLSWYSEQNTTFRKPAEVGLSSAPAGFLLDSLYNLKVEVISFSKTLSSL
jgi:hypothetical protein